MAFVVFLTDSLGTKLFLCPFAEAETAFGFVGQ